MKKSRLLFTLVAVAATERRRQKAAKSPTEVEDGEVGIQRELALPERPARAATSGEDASRHRLAALTFLCAVGLCAVTVAFALSRSGRPFAEPLFWVGLITIFVPAALRLASPLPSRSERLVLAVVVGVALYLVKFVHDAFQFTFADDLVHAYNASEIVRTGSLFGENPILPVTPHYPGLETVTAALVSMTGMTVFAAGAIVIGIARAILMFSLFLLFEEISGSARVAGLAALLYAAAPTYLFFDAQFSYESLALPLLVTAVFAVARWMRLSGRSGRLQWSVATAFLIIAIVPTHHMTSYVLAAVLVIVAFIHLTIGMGNRRAAPIGFALLAVGSILAWLIFIANDTVDYLTPVFTSAFEDTVRTISAETATRELFTSEQGGQPLWDRYVGFAATAVIALPLPIGLRSLWLNYRRNALALVLGSASVAYLGALGLRLVPGAWEVASRASGFLYIGTAFVLSLAVVSLWPTREPKGVALAPSLPSVPAEVASRLKRAPASAPVRSRFGSFDGRRLVMGRGRWIGSATFGLALAIVFAGGVVLGRPNDLRLVQPLRIAVHGTTLSPEGNLASEWARDYLGVGHRFASDPSNARLLMLYGGQTALTGKDPPVEEVIRKPRLAAWQVRLLHDHALGYVLVDRRRRSGSPSRGYFFCVTTNPCELFDEASFSKFENETTVSKLFDSGHVSVYDVRALTE